MSFAYLLEYCQLNLGTVSNRVILMRGTQQRSATAYCRVLRTAVQTALCGVHKAVIVGNAVRCITVRYAGSREPAVVVLFTF